MKNAMVLDEEVTITAARRSLASSESFNTSYAAAQKEFNEV